MNTQQIFSYLFIIYSIISFNLNAVELYAERPDILAVDGISHRHDHAWHELMNGHLQAIAQILGLYPEHDIYFLARDGELLYDLARLLTSALTQDEIHKKLHLINVSRLSMESPLLKKYLEQNGISENKLLAGQKVLLIDTGFLGSISKAIAELYPPQAGANIQTHLMCSDNKQHPSCRMFLLGLNPLAAKVSPTILHGSIISYEHRPRYTNRADRYVDVLGKLTPAAPLDGASDGQVDRNEALKDMQSLKFFALLPATGQEYEEMLKLWRSFYQLIRKKDKAEILTFLQKNQVSEGFIRDAQHWLITNSGDEALAKTLDLEQSLRLQAITGVSHASNKITIMNLYAPWRIYLNNVQAGIATLLENSDYHTLRAIADVVDDVDFNRLLAINLAHYGQDTNKKKDIRAIVGGVIENNDHKKRSALIKYAFSNSACCRFGKELSLMIPYCNWQDCFDLDYYVMSQSHAKHFKEQLVELMAHNPDKGFLGKLLYNHVLGDNSAHFQLALIFLIENHQDIFGDYDLAFSGRGQKLLADFPKQFALLLEIGDSQVREVCAWLIKNDYSGKFDAQLTYLITVASPQVKAKIATEAFNRYGLPKRKNALRVLIKKSDARVRNLIIAKVFQAINIDEFKEEIYALLSQLSDTEWITLNNDMKNCQSNKYLPQKFRKRGPPTINLQFHALKEVIHSADAMVDKEFRNRLLKIRLDLPDDFVFTANTLKKGVFFQNKTHQNLNEIQKKLDKKWTKHGVDQNPEAFALIIDVDKTLVEKTNDIHKPNTALPCAAKFLSWAKNLGITIIICSAHDDYKNTAKKLEVFLPLNLAGVKASTQDSDFIEHEILLTNYYHGGQERLLVDLYHDGLIVAVKDKDDVFSHKAFSLSGLPLDSRHKLKFIALIDDSEDYLRTFVKDIQEYIPHNLPNFLRADALCVDKNPY